MSNSKPIQKVAIIGTGVIGESWTALFLAKGLDVIATDIAPGAEAALRRFVDSAWPALKRLGLAPGASQARLTFIADMPTAVKGVDLVQENAPERIDFKRKLYHQLDELLPAEVIIASSSSGLIMSEIQADCRLHPERCVIGHPFNPPHLMPLVEVVGGKKTSEGTIQRAMEFYSRIGKKAVRLHKELPGHVANRFQAAVAREVYYLVAEGVLSAADADAALSWGPGLRWGIMGNMMLNHLGGGPGGIEHFFHTGLRQLRRLRDSIHKFSLVHLNISSEVRPFMATVIPSQCGKNFRWEKFSSRKNSYHQNIFARRE